MAEFMLELDNANLRETQLKTTNKKLTAISHRAQVQAEELQRVKCDSFAQMIVWKNIIQQASKEVITFVCCIYDTKPP